MRQFYLVVFLVCATSGCGPGFDESIVIQRISPSDVCTDGGQFGLGDSFSITGTGFGDAGGEIKGVLATVDTWSPTRIQASINFLEDPGTYSLRVCPADAFGCSRGSDIQVRNGCN